MATGRPDFKYVSDAQAVAYLGTVVKTDVTPTGITVTVALDGAVFDGGTATTAHNVSVSVKGTCDAGPATLSANVSWTGPALATTKPSVYVTEY
jgi:hypothetical protein